MLAPFFQRAAGPLGRQGGSGLGLSIVKELVTKLGGQIAVESLLDRGTRSR